MDSVATEDAKVFAKEDESPEKVEVKPDLKEIVSATFEGEDSSDYEGSDFDIKEEIDKRISDSESSNGSENLYHTVITGNYTWITVKEEPVENIKSLFKRSPLDFEKHKYHQQIFERIVESSSKVNSKDLRAQYLSELRRAASIEIFACPVCNYQSMHLVNIKCHLLVFHNAKTERQFFRCSICKFEANTETCIKQHTSTHKMGKETDKITLSVKQKKSMQKEVYPCPECRYQGRTEDALQKHLLVHKDRTKCDLCSFESKNKVDLQMHKNTHKEGDKKFKCYMCTYSITNKATLGRHLLNVHKIANEASKRSKMCEICSFSCSSKNQLQIHYLTHKTVNDLKEHEIFKCPEPGCNHQTKLKCHLRIHMKVHKAPQFVCEICGFASRRKESYKNHLTTHKRLSDIEWFCCEICPYRARNKKLLRRHMRNGDHSGKLLRHIRNRDRKREAEEISGGDNSFEDGKSVISKEVSKKPGRRRKKVDINSEQISESCLK